MTKYTTEVLSSGKIKLPGHLLRKLDLQPGDTVEIEHRNIRTTITKVAAGTPEG